MTPSTEALALQIYTSRQFVDWLATEQISLALTTYQSSRLLLLGTHAGRIAGFERVFERAMGLYASTERLYLSSKYQIWQIDNVLEPDQRYNGYDKLYVPRISHTTGDLDIHDLAIDASGRILFVSTLLNCLATVSQRHSCTPLWKPPFISQLVNEDRCHLNGLALEDGFPRYVTACSRADVIDGWRDQRRSGGCVVDLRSNQIICAELSMPHSPRCYQDRLWLLNSGEGELGWIDRASGRFEPVTFCPGYLRGLAFWHNYAIVGLSRPRQEDQAFAGLALEEKLAAKQSEAYCGVLVIDLTSGTVAHWLRLEGVVTELYDVQVLPQVQRPMALGFQTDEIARLLTLDPMAVP
ncbi:MAG: TIGR03032 family protein [Elainella sp.]